MPRWLLSLRQRLALWAGLDPASFVQALVIRYDPGAGIGWHRDRPVFDEVHGLSLGTPAVLRLRRRTDAGFERFALPLPPGSLYSLRGTAREAWEHSIAPIGELRWSITFRTLRGALRRA
jgi:alkylated DNA repair dioxygenase AlkB